MNRTLLHWLLLLGLALGMHLATAALLIQPTDTSINAAQGDGADGLAIGFGNLGSYRDAQQRLQQQQQAELQKQTDLPEPVKTEPPRQQTAAPLPPAKAETTPTELAVVQPEPVVETPPPVNPVTETVAETKPVANTAATAEQANQHRDQENAVKGTGRSQQQNLGGRKGDANKYFSELKLWLNEHKHYPAALKKAKQQGIVTVRFTIAQDGSLLKAAIKKGSGYRELDQAALQLMHNASPMPEIPDFFQRDRLTIALPIEYSLIDE